MDSEKRRILGLIGVLVVVLGVIVWQTTGQLRDSRTVPAYELTPPTFGTGKDPSIIDVAKLSDPLIPDQAYVRLLAQGRADFALVGGLRVSDRAGLVARMKSEDDADRVIGLLGADADNLAGASAKLLQIQVRDYSDKGALVSAFASYTIAGQTPAFRTITFAYAPEGAGYRLDDVSESTGASS